MSTEFGQSAFMNNLSASNAADKQMEAIMAAIAEQRREFDTTQKNMAPWLKSGQGAVSMLSSMMQPGGELYKTTPTLAEVEMDPGYQFGLSQSLDAIRAKMGSLGLSGSGNMGKALIDYANDAATGDYQQAYNNWMQGKNMLYNRLAGLSGTGQVTAGELGNMGQNNANAISGLWSQYGNAAASGVPNYSGAFQSLNNNLVSGLGTYLNWQQQQNMLNNMQSMYGGFNNTGYMSGGYGGDTNLGTTNYFAGDAGFAM